MSSLIRNKYIRNIVYTFTGTIAQIPSGMQLCDGTNGHPDLRNKMIVCADADAGGVAKTTVTGAALQSGGAKDHTMLITELVPHDHEVIGHDSVGGGALALAHRDVNSSDEGNFLSGGTETTGGGVAMPIMNPFYALAFITRI